MLTARHRHGGSIGKVVTITNHKLVKRKTWIELWPRATDQFFEIDLHGPLSWFPGFSLMLANDLIFELANLWEVRGHKAQQMLLQLIAQPLRMQAIPAAKDELVILHAQEIDG
jgi:hypothetical protein